MMMPLQLAFSFFFFNDTATTEIYTLSLHDALPIFLAAGLFLLVFSDTEIWPFGPQTPWYAVTHNPEDLQHKIFSRSEEHTSELQSRLHLVCRLLLEKKTTVARHLIRSGVIRSSICQ